MGSTSAPNRTLRLTLEVVNRDIWFLDRKRLVILFLCDAHLWCQVSRTLLQYIILPRIGRRSIAESD